MLPHPKVWKMLLSESWGVYDGSAERRRQSRNLSPHVDASSSICMYTIYYLVVVDDVCAGARHFIRVSALESGSRLRCHLPLATEAQIPFHFLSIQDDGQELQRGRLEENRREEEEDNQKHNFQHQYSWCWCCCCCWCFTMGYKNETKKVLCSWAAQSHFWGKKLQKVILRWCSFQQQWVFIAWLYL